MDPSFSDTGAGSDLQSKPYQQLNNEMPFKTTVGTTDCDVQRNKIEI
jgi:hypothetical protein